MPRYVVTTQALSPSDARHERALQPELRPFEPVLGSSHRANIVEGTDLCDVAHRVNASQPDVRLVSIEEIFEAPEITDEQITEAFTNPNHNPDHHKPLIDPEQFVEHTEPIRDQIDFPEHIENIAEALSDSQLVPGLDASIISSEGMIDYAMITIYDAARNHYRGHGCELKNLVDDRDAIGWNGVLSIARTLISISSDLR